MNPKITLVVRIVLALFMIMFGLNKFIHFMTFPPVPEPGGTLMGIYFMSGFLTLVGALEVAAGLALLVGKFIPISLTLIIAIMFNAVMFHVLYDPATIMGSLIGLVLALFLVYAYKDKFGTYLSA